jgi:Arc/MetJ family transcription regulator
LAYGEGRPIKEFGRDEIPVAWGSWEDARALHRWAFLQKTAAQRLAWLEEALEIAYRSGAIKPQRSPIDHCDKVRIQSLSPETALDFEIFLCSLMCSRSHMATNLSLDPKLLDRALAVSGERTKKAAVTRALEEFIARRRQKHLLDLMGKLEWDRSYDYKSERNRR